MDSQIKKGILEISVLAVLSQHDAYGYQLIIEMANFVAISESTLYTILKRLINNGYATSYSIEYNGRLRKYYKITESGITHIEQFIREWTEIDKIIEFIKESRE